MSYQAIESLDKLMGGAMTEKFRVALAETMANIIDPNTKPTAKRTITVTVSFAPAENRDVASIAVDVKTKLSAPVPASSTVYIGFDENGVPVATEKTDQIPGQIDLEGREAPMPNVLTFEAVK